ncbi:MAG TPA: DUF937 domain-containing protein [Chitinophagales bacterium]|nr:DUF937 domain-containing protein [Chitinophagales bacterium]HMW13849.1 DUF937 domain-containing protein [Chitinophagales bacterium]HMX59387.1 DUF937 domain-containing protein [Chitinophagales bacterium]HMY23915.1 DUF937 domain-containing protein [Chitinophagales bacterium]HMZ32671.1 DUF937 domain-containing protein [Chitinophagales bacterium]
MDLQQLMNGAIGQQATQLISSQLGIDANQAQSAVGLALPTLLNALNKNASTNEGAASLYNAITKDHANGGVEDLAGMAQNALSSGEGSSILKHILGGLQPNVENAISQNAGIGGGQAGQILQILAPLVLKTLGNQTQSQGLDIGGLAGLLTNVVSNQQQQTAPQQNDIISQLLDRDKDGSVIDDVAGLLGNLFKK